MALTADEIAVLRTRLAEAEVAYHQLMTGGSPVRVQDQTGQSVTYTTANATRLYAYIQRLKDELRTCPVPNCGPIRPVFP